MTLSGERLKSFKPHGASISDIIMDATGDFVGTSSIDGMTFLPKLSSITFNSGVIRTDRHSFAFYDRGLCIRPETTYADIGPGATIREEELACVRLRRIGRELGHAREGMVGP